MFMLSNTTGYKTTQDLKSLFRGVTSLTLLGLLSACSMFSSAPEPKAIDLETNNIQTLAKCSDPIERLDSGVYRCPEEGSPFTFSLFRTCHLPDRLTSKATTRQLLTGFEQLRITGQKDINVSGTALLETDAVAALDQLPLAIKIYSHREADCVTDLVLWSDPSASGGSAINQESSRDLASHLLASPDEISEGKAS